MRGKSIDGIKGYFRVYIKYRILAKNVVVEWKGRNANGIIKRQMQLSIY
jgi:hypothetical protein